MGENFLAKMHEVTILLYAFCVLLYFIDFLQNNRKAKQWAAFLLSIIWALQTVFFLLYMIDIGRFPILTLGEGLYFYVWIIISLTLVFHKYSRIEFLSFFTSILGFILMVILTFAPFRWQSEALAQNLASELLFIHITMSIVAYGAFSLSFIFSLLYLFQYRLLKKKKWGIQLMRMDNLVKLENMSYILNALGMPIFLLGVILGLQWAYIKIPHLSWFDWKIVGSFMLIGIYGLYLYVKLRKEMAGKSLAFYNIGAFLFVLINFFLLGKLSAFHFWLQ
ncbi:cytochrome C assembly family protein [Bacillus kwashiorkori]|uniref:cytochrome C assembly family protein n=1 Tax=Bacillus kwashiorkori TaxID=1522318 RepID=UPI00078290B0|nr:cytochrome c biogenesis protein CcsA [Bacillus kwashiorkori]